MFSAEINNYNDDLHDSFDEMSVMLAELNEMLDEGNVGGVAQWVNSIKQRLKSASSAAWNHFKAAVKTFAQHFLTNGRFAVNWCTKHTDSCKELANHGFNQIEKLIGG